MNIFARSRSLFTWKWKSSQFYVSCKSSSTFLLLMLSSPLLPPLSFWLKNIATSVLIWKQTNKLYRKKKLLWEKIQSQTHARATQCRKYRVVKTWCVCALCMRSRYTIERCERNSVFSCTEATVQSKCSKNMHSKHMHTHTHVRTNSSPSET